MPVKPNPAEPPWARIAQANRRIDEYPELMNTSNVYGQGWELAFCQARTSAVGMLGLVCARRHLTRQWPTPELDASCSEGSLPESVSAFAA